MSSQSSNLFSLARNKLNLSLSNKDNYSLHRWVLLKNSIVRSDSLNSTSVAAPTTPTVSPTLTTTTAPSTNNPDVNHVFSPFEGDLEEEEETDSFMFPDAGKLGGDGKGADTTASEAEWLDSLLVTLGEDDDEEFNVDSTPTLLPAEDDEDQLLSPLVSPLVSPMSSSDDLVNHAYCSPPISVPYPVPYPPLVHPYELDSIYSPLDSSDSLPYDHHHHHPLPYHDFDDVEDLSVPDAIEDTSDDESDATTTPSVIQSSLADSTSTSLPDTRRRRPQVYINTDEEQSYCYPFELDPLPFSDHFDSYNPYHEC
jgi:hypothetical protein